MILITPLIIYPLGLRLGDDILIINLRQIREISFFSFGIIVCSFLIKNKFLRLFGIWCVLNWWLNYFFPPAGIGNLSNILAAFIIYIGIKDFKFLNINVLMRIICVTALFQFAWMIMQMFNYDPVFYPITHDGLWHKGQPMPLIGWSGNPCILGVSLASSSFLFFNYFKIKKLPILFFVMLSSLLFLKNATTALCFAAGLLFYIFTRYKLSKKYIMIGILILLVLGSYFLLVKQPNFDRLLIWKKIFNLGIDLRPITGRGLSFFAQFNIVDKTGTIWQEAHNEPLQIYLELGLIGLILFLGFVISKFIEFFQKANTLRQYCMMASLVALLTSSISMFPFHLAQLSFTGIMLLACLERTYSDTDNLGTVNI